MSQTQSGEHQSAPRSIPDPLSTDVEPVGTGLLGSPASLIDNIKKSIIIKKEEKKS